MLPAFLFAINYVRILLLFLVASTSRLSRIYTANRAPIMSLPIPENVQVLNTIIKLLSHIPRKIPLSPRYNLSDKDWQTPAVRQEIKLLDAFAQLMVSRHEVVAVASYRTLSLELMAALSEERDEHAAKADTGADAGTDAEPKSTLKQCWDSFRDWILIATMNSRRDDPETCSSVLGPETIIPEAPSDLKDHSILSYLQALEAQWHKPTLSCHLWIINTVLTEISKHHEDEDGEENNLSSALYRYIIAMSFQKIQGRFQSPLSKHFMASIKAVEELHIKPPSEATWIDKSIENTEEHSQEGKHDYCLMTEYVHLAKDPELEQLVKTSVTNLNSIDIPEPQTAADFSKLVIYTDETYLEFHRLLKELLDRYEKATANLVRLDEERLLKTIDPNEFATCILEAQLVGYALLKLSRGRAFRQHVENIGHMLHPQAANKGAPWSNPKVNKDNKKPENNKDNGEDESNGEDEDRRDHDMDDATAAPHCVTWLRLMVAHLDAVDIILAFVGSTSFPYKSIQTTLLLSPLATLPLHPWKEVIMNTTYCSDPTSTSPVDNSGIVKFLEDSMDLSIRLKQLSELASRVRQKWDVFQQCRTSAKAKSVIKSLQNLLQVTLEDADAEYRKKINSAIKEMTALKGAPAMRLEKADLSIRLVVDEVYPLHESNRFFCSLKELTSQGAIHCEATLASLINNNATDVSYRNGYGNYVKPEFMEYMQRFGRVIGVSKRCCPVCEEYLFQMEKISKGLPIITQGVHTTYSSCTVPPWTAPEVVDNMIQKFGAKLREDLLALEQSMKTEGNTFFRRNRSDSTGSNSLSAHGVPSSARSKPNLKADAKRRIQEAREATAAEARRRAAEFSAEDANAEEADAEEADAEEADAEGAAAEEWVDAEDVAPSSPPSS